MTVSLTLDWPAALAAARAHALAAGALKPIAVEGETVVDGGVPFRVEWISSLAMKDLAGLPRAGDKAKGANPFLPYERDLWVADLSETHVAILNKFPVWNGHFLMITRSFVDQEAPLDLADAKAIGVVLAAVEGFVFYNSGGAAGASQSHRHLQMLPGFEPAITALTPSDGAFGELRQAPSLPFKHVFCRLDRSAVQDGQLGGAQLLSLVTEACRAAGVICRDARMSPYNLLLTRDWLMIVPRRQESVEGLSLSALGYSGLIGLRTPDQIDLVRRRGPMPMLSEAAG